MTPEVAAVIDATVRADRERVAPGADLVAVGWSTVELERAAIELGLVVRTAADDVALGARCAIARPVEGRTIVLLGPVTEGRLARSLARLGEGPVATWWAVSEVTAAGPSTRPPTAGPFGPERRLAGPDDDRSLFLIERGAATIRP